MLSLSLAACASRENRDTTTTTVVTTNNTGSASEPDASATSEGTTTSTATNTVAQSTDAGSIANAARDAATSAVAAARPLYFDRDISDADLANRTLRELAIMRNTPYARMGHRFRRPWLSQYFSSQSWYHSTRQVADNELNERDRRNAQAVGRFDTALSREALEALATALRQRDERGLLQEGDEVEAVLLSQRLGRNITITRATNRDSTPLDDPDQLDTVLERRELLEMSPRDLWILRNMIYARRGRPFRSSILLEYFEGTSWYHPEDTYNDARLRRVDRQNLRMIQSVEAEIGGPTNAQSEAEMAMYGA